MNCSIEFNGGDISKATASRTDVAETATLATVIPINTSERLFIGIREYCTSQRTSEPHGFTIRGYILSGNRKASFPMHIRVSVCGIILSVSLLHAQSRQEPGRSIGTIATQ